METHKPRCTATVIKSVFNGRRRLVRQCRNSAVKGESTCAKHRSAAAPVVLS